jgi:hypothetical protein
MPGISFFYVKEQSQNKNLNYFILPLPLPFSIPFLASFPPFTSYHTYFLQHQLKGMHRRPSTLPRENGDQSIANKNKNYVIIGKDLHFP